MTFSELLLGFGGLFLTAFGFLFGRMFSQSEKILDQKRRAYEDFLSACPTVSEASDLEEPDFLALQRKVGILSLYGSFEALTEASKYFQVFIESQPILQQDENPEHPQALKLVTAYNRMVWHMRNDVMSWSFYAPTRKSREYKPTLFLPEDDK